MGLTFDPAWTNTFLGQHYSIRLVEGPISLCRLLQHPAESSTALVKVPAPYWYFGDFWFLADVFWRVLDAKSSKAQLPLMQAPFRVLLRDITAISENWSQMTQYTQLDIPRGVAMEFAVGTAAPQSRISGPRWLRETEPSLSGGITQYCIDYRSLLEFKQYISRPMPLWLGRSGRA